MSVELAVRSICAKDGVGRRARRWYFDEVGVVKLKLGGRSSGRRRGEPRGAGGAAQAQKRTGPSTSGLTDVFGVMCDGRELGKDVGLIQLGQRRRRQPLPLRDEQGLDGRAESSPHGCGARP